MAVEPSLGQCSEHVLAPSVTVSHRSRDKTNRPHFCSPRLSVPWHSDSNEVCLHGPYSAREGGRLLRGARRTARVSAHVKMPASLGGAFARVTSVDGGGEGPQLTD